MTYLVPIETTPVGRPVQMVFVTRLCPVGRLVPDASLLLRWLLSCLSLLLRWLLSLLHSPVEMAPAMPPLPPLSLSCWDGSCHASHSLLSRCLLSCFSLSPVEMAPVMPLTLSCRDGSCHASHPLLLIWLLSCLSPIEMAPVSWVFLKCSCETYSCPVEMPSFPVRHLFPVEMLSVRLVSRLTPVERPLACLLYVFTLITCVHETKGVTFIQQIILFLPFVCWWHRGTTTCVHGWWNEGATDTPLSTAVAV